MTVVDNMDPIETNAAEAPAAPRPHGGGRMWHAFTRFRRTRPFWGSIILALGGYFVMLPILGGSFELLMHFGTRGITVYILGGGMIAAALVSMFAPAQRHFPALMAAVFSVASLPLANLGGWIIGMALGIIGSGLVFAWTPYSDKQLAKFAERDERRAQRKAYKQAEST